MSANDKSIPSVFILESLSFDDELSGDYEGEIISKILRISGIEHEYYYYRTVKELDYFINEFKKSRFRYLHISCHGNSGSINTTLNEVITIEELSLKLESVLDKRRLFISACSITNDKLANVLFKNTECYSLIGSNKDIPLKDAAIFWASFYHLMFNRDKSFIRHSELSEILKTLTPIYKLSLSYYRAFSSKTSGWKKII